MSYLKQLKDVFEVFYEDDMTMARDDRKISRVNSRENKASPGARNGQVQFSASTKTPGRNGELKIRNSVVGFTDDVDSPQAGRPTDIRLHSARSEVSHLTRDGLNDLPTSNDNNDGSSSSSSSHSVPDYEEEIIKPGEGALAEFRYQCGKFINHRYAQNFISFIILANTILLIVSTYLADNNTTDPDTGKVIRSKGVVTADTVDTVFLVIFTVESSLQLIYHDVKLFKNRWHTFDLTLVILSWFLPKLTVVRCLRVLKIASKFEALQKLIRALIDVIPNITAIFSLLLLVFYIFAVMFTTLFKKYDKAGDLEAASGYFDRLDRTLFSLFQFMTMDWQEAARDCQKQISWAPILFIMFEIASGFIVFNLIVAVLCEALGLLDKDTREDEEEIVEERERLQAIQSLMIQVEQVREKQRVIRKTLQELDGGSSLDEGK